MELSEYTTMFELEDRHWWYNGLRELLLCHWAQHLWTECPAVLDVGCGTGANLVGLDDLAARLVGIDFAPEAIRLCRTRGLSCTAVASALALPFGGETFDAVVSCDVLCHSSITDKSVVVREMHRVLRPGGMVFLNLPAYQWLFSSHDRALPAGPAVYPWRRAGTVAGHRFRTDDGHLLEHLPVPGCRCPSRLAEVR
jgi:ubiquinone/menaquinone biosynthesis C-methylase UbiE